MIEDVEFLVGREAEVFHAADNLGDTRAARAIKATGFHLDPSQLARFDEEFAVSDLGGGVCRKNGDACHKSEVEAIAEFTRRERRVPARLRHLWTDAADKRRLLGLASGRG